MFEMNENENEEISSHALAYSNSMNKRSYSDSFTYVLYFLRHGEEIRISRLETDFKWF